ncbi:hypothetical protein [Streptomyces sp. SID2888]|uniref:hypothetical protein n=1 Tax=Streptomyces sp. SID2888 TaxID=2690256 RepID=UPI0013685235|nr:hypothetical protein [Streptomyces sp. SID2888]MYV47971.1 hypothetical protein [Streptomyces sp. SID2888]
MGPTRRVKGERLLGRGERGPYLGDIEQELPAAAWESERRVEAEPPHERRRAVPLGTAAQNRPSLSCCGTA